MNENGNPKPSSYAARSLRGLGENEYMYDINGKMVDLRELEYDFLYNNKNDPANKLYYVAEVLIPIYGKTPCKAAPAFDFPGGALQIELEKPFSKLIKSGHIKILTPNEIKDLFKDAYPNEPGVPVYFPKFNDINLEEADPKNYQTYSINRVTNYLINRFYGTTHKERMERRRENRQALRLPKLDLLDIPEPEGSLPTLTEIEAQQTARRLLSDAWTQRSQSAPTGPGSSS